MPRFFAALLLALAAVLPAAAEKKPVSDDHLYDTVRRRLANDAEVKGGALDIDVKEGVVTLRGPVEYEKQKHRAERLVKKISGVKQVRNEITVGRRPPR